LDGVTFHRVADHNLLVRLVRMQEHETQRVACTKVQISS
jgi:hypothetical protein